MRKTIKNVFVNTLSLPILSTIGERVFRQNVPIFMLHRFQCNSLGIEGHKNNFLRFALEYMAKRKYNFVSIDEVAVAIRNQELLPERSVAFTIDDGYWDQIEASGILFANYSCPATYFVTTKFIDEELWFWDAKIRYIVEQANLTNITAVRDRFPTIERSQSFDDGVASQIIFGLANSSLSTIEKSVKELAAAYDVAIPAVAPKKYGATSWGRLNDMVRMGLAVGAHSCTHPVLSRENSEISRREIFQSKERLLSKVKSPSEVFCFPIGRASDFGVREMGFVKEAGFIGAVSTIPAAANTFARSSLFSIPRFGFPNNTNDFIQYVSWIESFKGWAYNRK